MTKAREFLDFWVQNSVHATEQYRASGGDQVLSVLVVRCIEMAETQGLAKADLEGEVGDLHAHILKHLKSSLKLRLNALTGISPS